MYVYHFTKIIMTCALNFKKWGIYIKIKDDQY